MNKSFLKFIVGLWVIASASLFAENIRPANIPQDWPEECTQNKKLTLEEIYDVED